MLRTHHGCCVCRPPGQRETLARCEQAGVDFRTEVPACAQETGRVAGALLGEGPVVAGNGVTRPGRLYQAGRIDVIHVAEHSVDARQDQIGLQIDERPQQPQVERGVAGQQYAHAVEVQQQAQGRRREVGVVGGHGMHDDAAQVVGPARFEKVSLLPSHAGLLEPLRTARRPGETALRVPPDDDRDGVGIEVVGVLVRQHDEIGADLFCGHRRQRKPLEAVQALHRVGEVGVGVDGSAGGRLEGEARLPRATTCGPRRRAPQWSRFPGITIPWHHHSGLAGPRQVTACGLVACGPAGLQFGLVLACSLQNNPWGTIYCRGDSMPVRCCAAGRVFLCRG